MTDAKLNRAPSGRGDAGRVLAEAAEAYIEAHSAEKFSLQAVADALYVNKCYLLRQFKAHTGCTLLSYHNQVRCEQAKQMLRELAETSNAVQSNEVFEMADEQGISKRTLENAKKELGIRAKKINNSWYWELDKVKSD